MPTGIIFTTNSFYKIDNENFNCKSKLNFYFVQQMIYYDFFLFSGFYTDSIAKTHDYRPMFLCELTRNKEYLLCYNVYGVFVDADGEKTRSGEMKWPYFPKCFGKLLRIIIINNYNI